MNKESQEFFALNPKLSDLHVHIGSITHPALLWDIAHECGLKMPVKNYWDFQKMLVIVDKIKGEDAKTRLNKYLKFFDLTEKIQSSPYAMNKVVYDAVSGAYRKNNITCLELRFCPMWRNNKGEHDLDQIIIATIHALDRSMIAFPEVKVGLILNLDRRLSKKENTIILEKAIKYKNRGVVAIDIAGPRIGDFDYASYCDLYQEATKKGLKTTIHTGEEGSVEEMKKVIEALPLNRIGHGIKAHLDKKLMKKLRDLDICLEICPTSNLKLGIVKDIKELNKIIRTFLENEVKFTINTDGPELLQTTIKEEIAILLDNEIVNFEEMNVIIENGFKYSFISS